MVVVFLIIAFVEWRAYGQILQRDQPSLTAASEWTALWLTLSATGVGVIALWLLLAARRPHPSRTSVFGVATLGLIGLAFWFLNVFSGAILPRIPEQYGGLQPKRAQQLFAKEAFADARSMGVVFTDGTHLSAPVRVLYEGDNNYVLQLDDDRVVQLAREQVVGSITDSKPPTPRAIYERDRAGDRYALGQGDQIVWSFSEPMNPASLLPGWTGSTVDVIVRIKGMSDGGRLTVFERSNRFRVALGMVRVRQPEVRVRQRSADAEMTLQGKDVVITLDEALPLRRRSKLTWRPSTQAKDAVGNSVLARELEE